ncbi:MAG: flagellar export protein FliJ [Lachnospiraceae bacterium]|nr:flagellar export protein FliJ [Lachnospiraceae bacterium]
MAKFIYRMQSILDIKVKLEEQARMEFATAKMRLNEEEEKLSNLVSRREAYVLEGRKLQESGLNVLEIMENRTAIENMKELIARQEVCVRQAEVLADEAAERLTQAMQESKTHTRLKERAFEEFLQEENKREAKEVDELTSYTYGQRMKK